MSGILKEELQTELNFSWRDQKTADPPELSGDEGAIGRSELGMIPGVEKLGPKLSGKPLADARVFDKSHIPVIDPRFLYLVSTGIPLDMQAVRACNIRWTARKNEGIDVKPIVYRPVRGIRWTDLIGNGCAKGADIQPVAR